MNVDDILFVGGDPAYLPSVKIRCLEIARRLGCRVSLCATSVDELPRDARLFVCVKPSLDFDQLVRLRGRGIVVWDVVDALPPVGIPDCLLVSSCLARDYLASNLPVFVLPHYHCNFERNNSDGKSRVAVWIGTEHWFPRRLQGQVQSYFLENASRESVASYFRSAGLCVNSRRTVDSRLHLKLNSGIKLINSIGFGVPSVSDREPAYLEFDQECTIFCDKSEVIECVDLLRRNDALYGKLRANCIELAERFHIDNIVQLYKDVLSEIQDRELQV